MRSPTRRGGSARRPRSLLGYMALWTLYGVIAKGSQDIHVDMSEQFVLVARVGARATPSIRRSTHG